MVLFTAHCSPQRGICPCGGLMRCSSNHCPPLLNHRLTIVKLLFNNCLTIARLSLGHCSATAWLLLGYRLAIVKLLFNNCLTIARLSLGYCLAIAWPLLNHRLTIVQPSFNLIQFVGPAPDALFFCCFDQLVPGVGVGDADETFCSLPG
jgi:hypothetical protein